MLSRECFSNHEFPRKMLHDFLLDQLLPCPIQDHSFHLSLQVDAHGQTKQAQQQVLYVVEKEMFP
jgi:hypothetical protein